jgi:hypothetical protein
MTVRYITVTPVTNLFKPVTRSFGDIAIIGAALAQDVKLTATDVTTITTGVNSVAQLKQKLKSTYPRSEDVDAFFTTNNIQSVSGFSSAVGITFTADRKAEGPVKTPIPITNPDSVSYKTSSANGKAVDSPAWFNGDLGRAVRKAFAQTPGPTVVWATCTASSQGTASLSDALAEVAKLDAQLIVLANTPLKSATVGKTEIELLADHVKSVSNTGGDGKERIGIAMLGNGITDVSVITTNMASPRMVMVAHKSDEDAAAAVAGTIAGYQPHISLLLKAVSLGMEDLFSDSEIDGFNTARVNWLTDPTLLPGKGLFMGEGYTLGADIPYIDIMRTIDDISFRLKAALIRSIGNLRVSRAGLRALVSQMAAVLEPLKQQEVIEEYDIFLPLLVLLDKPPATLTDSELQQIQNAQNARVVDAIVSVDYAGAIHRLNITLKFE